MAVEHAEGSDPPPAVEATTQEAQLGTTWRDRIKFEPISLGHMIQIVAILAVGLSALKLLRVAHGDPGLAIAILQGAGYVAPVAGVFLIIVPSVILYLLLHFVEYRLALFEAKEPRAFIGWPILVIIWLVFALATFAEWIVFLGALVLVPLYGVADRAVARRNRINAKKVPVTEFVAIRRRQVSLSAALLIAPLVFSQAVSSNIWTNLDLIVTNDGQHYQGAVLQRDGEWFTILVNEPRYIAYIRASDVRSRESCQSKGSRTVFQVLGSESDPGGRVC